MNVEIIDAPLFYDINVFNKCEETGSLLVTLECWKDIHPAFKTIPLSSGESMPYGIIYSKTPTEDALRFLDSKSTLATIQFRFVYYFGKIFPFFIL